MPERLLKQVSRLDLPFMSIERCSCTQSIQVTERFENADAFLIQVHLIGIGSYQVSSSGQEIFSGGLPGGSISIRDMRRNWVEVIEPPFDRISMRLNLDELRLFAVQLGRPEFISLCCTEKAEDTSLNALVSALIPAISSQQQTSAVFLEQMAMAMLIHITVNYGRLYFPPHRKGALSAQNEARAVEILKKHVVGEVPLVELAKACGFSRSYFSKAFKKTFGKSPHRWLSEYRLAKASELLKTDMAISQIAHECGFSDQSHLTRSFTEVVGETPGAWRRLFRVSAHGTPEIGQ